MKQYASVSHCCRLCLCYVTIFCALYTDEDGDSGVNLDTILAFATGVKEIPAAGFQQQPTLQFLHATDMDSDLSFFPKANTCACVMRLPVMHKSYRAFVDAMNTGILCAQGFGYE